jgi:hypothetical protein
MTQKVAENVNQGLLNHGAMPALVKSGVVLWLGHIYVQFCTMCFPGISLYQKIFKNIVMKHYKYPEPHKLDNRVSSR